MDSSEKKVTIAGTPAKLCFDKGFSFIDFEFTSGLAVSIEKE